MFPFKTAFVMTIPTEPSVKPGCVSRAAHRGFTYAREEKK